MSGECDRCAEHCLDCACKVQEDKFLRYVLSSTPGYIDLEDLTPIVFDLSSGRWLNAKELQSSRLSM